MKSRDRVLSWVVENPGKSRTDIVRGTGLSRSSSAQAIADLVETGELREDILPFASAGRGRPSGRIFPTLPDRFVLALDFNHTRVTVAVASLAGVELARASEVFDVDTDAEGAISCVARLVEELRNQEGINNADIAATVASVPGPLDRANGLVRSPTILSGWVGLHPATVIGERLGLPVHAFNDANLGAWGEFTYGAGRRFSDIIYVKASDGIGAGIVFSGTLFTGSRGLGGEIGHTPSQADGTLCRCGNSGCLEVMASSAAVRARLAFTRSETAASLPLAEYSDSASQRVFYDAGRLLGNALADACNLLNPEAVIIGGELGQHSASYVKAVRETIERVAQPATAASLQVLASELHGDAELRGALSQASILGQRLAFSLA